MPDSTPWHVAHHVRRARLTQHGPALLLTSVPATPLSHLLVLEHEDKAPTG